MEVKRKQFRKTEEAYEQDMSLLREFHQRWRNWTRVNQKGFFPVFGQAFQERTRDVSGNAIKLYLFLGAYTDSRTGECIVSTKTIEAHLKASRRSVQNWFSELKDHGLIIRIQTGFRNKTHTFMVPYHLAFVQENEGLKSLIDEYGEENISEKDSSEVDDNKNERLPFLRAAVCF